LAVKNTKLKEVVELTDKQERKTALNDALKKIEKNFGKGAIMRMGDKADTQIRTISTGSLALDTALGVGGYPRGRIVEIYGPESSGKTTVALHAVAEVQREGGTAAYIDAENALDPEYAKHLGVNIDDLLLSQPDTGEQGLEIADALVTSGAVDLVVVDSVAALVPRAEIDGEMGDAHVGLQARLMSQALRKLSGSINKTKTIAIFINQIREKVGVMFGSPETTPGGRALKFYATIRLEVRRSEQIKDGTDIIGNRTKIKVVKNKVAPPFKVAEVDIMYGKGISRTGELLDMAVEKDIVDKSGSWYSYNSDRIGQGRENAKQYIADHPDMEAELRTKVRHAYGIDGAADPDAKDADDQAKDKDSKDTPKADKDAKGTKDTKSAATDAKKPESKDSAKDTPKAKDTKAAADGESIDIFEGTDAKK
jgi:recombination protein RecA